MALPDLLPMMEMLVAQQKEAAKQRARLPKFSAENDALSYAMRIAQLKPGDEVLYGNVDDELKRAIYHGLVNEGQKAFVLYWDNEQEISYAACPLGALWFPDMIDAA